MRAVVVTGHGGSEALETREEAEPVAGERQLLVDVEAAGVNFRDVYERQGGGTGAMRRSWPGSRARGRSRRSAPAWTGLLPATASAWVSAPGSFAQRAVVDADKAVPVPDGVAGSWPAPSCCRA